MAYLQDILLIFKHLKKNCRLSRDFGYDLAFSSHYYQTEIQGPQRANPIAFSNNPLEKPSA
jgi:hypothetical protein